MEHLYYVISLKFKIYVLFKFINLSVQPFISLQLMSIKT